MNHTAKGGEPIWKCIRIRIFNEENRGSTLRTLHAEPGKGFTEKTVDNILDQVAEDLERRFPVHEYSLVPLGQGHFNFVWRTYRVAPVEQETSS